MIFKFITLDLERRNDQFSNEDGYSFYLISRSLCGYLERYVYSFKLKTDGYNQFSLKGYKNIDSNRYPYINSCQVLCADLDFDLEDYNLVLKTQNFEKINEYYIRFLIEGLKKIKDEFHLPKSKILEGIDLFRKENYINKWIFVKRNVTGKGLSCCLECQITLSSFNIDLVILEKGTEIKRESVITEIPNPLIYYNHFGDLKINKEGLIQISNRSKNIFYSKNIIDVL